MATLKRTRRRAAKACHRCNVKRIKCDATQGIPCTRCRQSGNLDCVLRQSRRGTYTRKSKLATTSNTNDGTVEVSQEQSYGDHESQHQPMAVRNQGPDDAPSEQSEQSTSLGSLFSISPVQPVLAVEESSVAEERQQHRQAPLTSSHTVSCPLPLCLLFMF